MRLPAVLIAFLAALGLALGAGAWMPAKAAEPCPMHAPKAGHHTLPAAPCGAACCLAIAVADIAPSPAEPIAAQVEALQAPPRLDGKGRTIQPGHGPPRGQV